MRIEDLEHHTRLNILIFHGITEQVYLTTLDLVHISALLQKLNIPLLLASFRHAVTVWELTLLQLTSQMPTANQTQLSKHVCHIKELLAIMLHLSLFHVRTRCSLLWTAIYSWWDCNTYNFPYMNSCHDETLPTLFLGHFTTLVAGVLPNNTETLTNLIQRYVCLA